MSLYNLFDVAGSAMTAQQIRLNLIASNLANAESISSSSGGTYKSRQPVFQAMVDQFNPEAPNVGVRVKAVVESPAPLRKEFNPGHPMADKDGYIFLPNVNSVEEMANMMSASRAFQSSVEVADTSKRMLSRLLQLGR